MQVSHRQDHARFEQLEAAIKSLLEKTECSTNNMVQVLQENMSQLLHLPSNTRAAIKSLEEKLLEEQKAQFEKMQCSIINKVQDLLQTSALPSNTSSLPHQAESSAKRSFQLCFKFQGDFPELYTRTNMEEMIDSLTVELCDHTGNKVDVGPELCSNDLKVEFLVLDGDLKDDYTKEDFKNVTPRKDKGPLLKDNNEVSLNNGSAKVRGFSFTDNSSRVTKNGKFRLGARLINGDRFGWIVRPAVSPPFKVKESRLKTDLKHPTPLPEDKLYHLKNISKTGEIYRRAMQGGVYTVMDFLQLYHTNPSELQSIFKVNGTRWKEIVDIAKECDLTKERYKYKYCDESGDVLLLKCDFKIDSVTFKGSQTSQPYESLDDSHKEYVGILRKAAYNKRKILPKVCDYSTNQTPAQAEIRYPYSVEQQEPNEQEQHAPAPSIMDPNVAYEVGLSDQIRKNPSTNIYSGTTAADHGSCQQDVMNASGSWISGNYGGDVWSVASEHQSEQVADNGLSSFTAAKQATMDMQQTFVLSDPSASLMPSQPDILSTNIGHEESTDDLWNQLLYRLSNTCDEESADDLWNQLLYKLMLVRKFPLVPLVICRWKRHRSMHCRPHKKQKT